MNRLPRPRGLAVTLVLCHCEKTADDVGSDK